MASIYDKASLVLIPSGTKTSKVFSQKPVNGDGDFTFSRSTAATRVNASGNIEKETQNLFTYSNTFTSWIKSASGVTLTSGQSGYDGSSDAYQIEKEASAFRFVRQGLTSPTGVVTFSVYMKAGTLTTATMRLLNSPDARAKFNLSTGALISSSNVIDTSSEDAGGGWYRYSMTANMTTMAEQVIYPDDITTSNAGTIFVQDAQLEQGLVARDYIETTTAAVEGGITDNVPRLDYTDSSCPALLLEPQRTNLASLSEYFAGWNNQTNVTITSNYTTSPEGLDNASRLLFTANGYIINSGFPNQSTGTQYTLSCYAKRNDNGTQNFGFFKNGSGSVDGAMALTSEWQRFDYTYTASNGSQLGLAGINGADVSVYGFQAEANASYATSYIPTYGTSVTRNNDETDVTGLQSKGILSSTQGTMFFHITDIQGTAVVFNAQTPNDLSYALRFVIRDTGFTTYQRVNDVQTTIRTDSLSLSEWKIAMSWNGTNLITSLNGTSYIDTIDASISSQLDKIARVNPQAISTTTNQILVFSAQLTEAELNDLTTL